MLNESAYVSLYQISSLIMVIEVINFTHTMCSLRFPQVICGKIRSTGSKTLETSRYDLSGNNKAVGIEFFPSLCRGATASLSRKLQIFFVSKGRKPNLHFYLKLLLLTGNSGVREGPLLLHEEWNEIYFHADFYLPSLAILNKKNLIFFHPASSIQYPS